MPIRVTLHNSDVGDLFVSVRDLNQADQSTILDSQRINQDEATPLTVQEDGNRLGNIEWSAIRTDDNTRTARRSVQPAAGDEIDVTTFFG